MARFAFFALALSMPVAGWAQSSPVPSPWQVSPQPKAPHVLNLSLTGPAQTADDAPDSRVVAGTEVLPNGMFGVGMFGEKTGESAHSSATVRDYYTPKQRKPAVGFSLKF